MYSKKTQKPYDINTYLFDIETYKDEDNFAIPYSVGLARLCKFKTYLSELISSEENILKEKNDRLMFSNDFIKVFTGECCIHQMFKYIGTHINSREITIIGHNSSGFDSYLVAQHFKLEKKSSFIIIKNNIINSFKPLYTCCFN